MTRNRIAAGLGGGFHVADCLYDFRITHVPVWIIILIDSEDAEMRRIIKMEGLKIGRVLGDDGGRLRDGVGEVHSIIGPVHAYFGWTRDIVPRLSKKVCQKAGICAIVKVQLEGHALHLRA
jgi:hypothetical protein